MSKVPEDKFDALVSVMTHYGMPHFMAEIDQIVARIEKDVLSAPLPSDPEKASLALYAARMRADGASAVRRAIQAKISDVRSKMEEVINERGRQKT